MTSNLSNLTDTERQEFIEQAQRARKLKREQGIEYAHKHLKLDYDEESYWKELSSKLGIRRFQWWQPANPKNMRKALKKVNRDVEWFKDITGFRTLKDHENANPSMSANAFIGFMMEEVNEEEL